MTLCENMKYCYYFRAFLTHYMPTKGSCVLNRAPFWVKKVYKEKALRKGARMRLTEASQEEEESNSEYIDLQGCTMC